VTNAAARAAGPKTETFATPAGRYLGYVVLGAAVVLCALGIRSQGTDAFGLVGFCAAFAALAWIVLIRPRVTARRNGLLLQNMLRDTYVPWAAIKTCRSAQTLQIGTRDKIYHGLGLTKSARQASREARLRGADQKTIVGPNLGMSSMAAAPTMAATPDSGPVVNRAKQEQVAGSYFSHAEQRIETLAREGAPSTLDAEPVVAWDPIAIAGLLVAPLGVIFAFFN